MRIMFIILAFSTLCASQTGVTISNTCVGGASPPCGVTITAGATFSTSIGGGGSGLVLSQNGYCTAGDIPNSPATDGPANMPARCYYTPLAATPSPGSVVSVTSAGQLTTALAAAVCGQTIQLQANTSYSGNFTVPALSCDLAHYVTIETAAFASLPGEFSRVNPSYAGVASLPGRPAFGGSSSNVMAQLIQPNAGSNSVLTIADGARGFRFIGLEITRTAGNGAVTSLLAFSGSADHIIFDRCWEHGTANDETRRFADLNNVSYFAAINNYATDFHCISSIGTCTDSQFISGGGSNPSATDGSYKFVNNFSEAAAEGMEFGGGPASFTPCDLEIRTSHFFKPKTWNPADPSYNGGVSGHAFIVKNGWETKNTCRVLMEGNIIQNVWEGFGQHGNAIGISPKNQAGNLCPVCIVQDFIFRYNYITEASQDYSIANTTADDGGWATAGNRFSFHDNISDGLMYPNRGGTTQNTMEFASRYLTATPPPATNVMNNVSFVHNTRIESAGQVFSGMLNLDGPPAVNTTSTPQMSNINYSNNLQASGNSTVFSATGDGSDNCVVSQPTLAAIISACWFPGSSFTKNAVVVQYSGSKTWPAGTLLAANWAAVGFVSYNNGEAGDYRLCTGVNLPASPCAGASPYAHAGSDGLDIGANAAMTQSYISAAQ